jgi:uncharacterized protein YecE (DUF72 family)
VEFGKVQYIDNIDFSLPPDDPETSVLWQRMEDRAESLQEPLRAYIGGTEWGRAGWVGKVYPTGTKSGDFLKMYARQLDTVELNTLFYGLQPPAVVRRWAAAVGEDFRFCPKFPEVISHKQQLAGPIRDTEEFIERVGHLGARLGPSFLQLPERFGPDRVGVLQDYVRRLPEGFRMCVELRHPAWFEGGDGRHGLHGGGSGDGAASKETWQLFRELGVGMVITDVAGRRDVLHMRLTAPFAFIRFVTNGLHSLDYVRADAWVARIKSWAAKGLREVYLFVHSPGEETSPVMMGYIIGKLNAQCGTRIRMPQLVNGGQAGNLSLF